MIAANVSLPVEKDSMVFRRLLTAFGVGGPSVDTVLRSPHTRPGEFLEGTVELVGGESEVLIEEISVCLASAVEVEAGDTEGVSRVEFARFPVTGASRSGLGSAIPFRSVTRCRGRHRSPRRAGARFRGPGWGCGLMWPLPTPSTRATWTRCSSIRFLSRTGSWTRSPGSVSCSSTWTWSRGTWWALRSSSRSSRKSSSTLRRATPTRSTRSR